jgi:hypothetical protein
MWNSTDVLIFMVFLLLCGGYSCGRMLSGIPEDEPFLGGARFEVECSEALDYEGFRCI